jgi:hypothetical protein
MRLYPGTMHLVGRARTACIGPRKQKSRLDGMKRTRAEAPKSQCLQANCRRLEITQVVDIFLPRAYRRHTPLFERNISLQRRERQINARANPCFFNSSAFFAASGKATLMQRKKPNDGMIT